MIRLSFLLLFLLALPSIAMAPRATALVVGAGPAGLAAAQRLQANKIAVTVLENQARVGGKCFSTPCKKGEGIVELGAIQVGIGYPKVNYYRKAMKLKLRKYWPSSTLDFIEGKAKPIYTDLSTAYWPMRDAAAIAREAAIMNRALARFQDFDSKHFVDMPSDSEFAQPFGQWADELGLTHFKEDFRIWITSYGYGQLEKVPAFLALSLINSSFGLVFMRRFDMNLRMLKVGYGGLLNRMVDHYKLDVRLESVIHDLERGPDGVRVTFSDQLHDKETHTYDHLILACGMGCAENVLAANQITDQEKELFQNLQVAPYDVVIAHIPQLKKGGFVLPKLLSEPGHISLISKNSSRGQDAILYIPRKGEADSNGRIPRPSEEELTEAVFADMKMFGFDQVEILQIQYWDSYFEHWTDPKFYRILDEIQGENRTYYIGGMARFEIVERAMEHAHDVVDEHILHIPQENKSVFGRLTGFANAFYDYVTAESRGN